MPCHAMLRYVAKAEAKREAKEAALVAAEAAAAEKVHDIDLDEVLERDVAAAAAMEAA